MNDVDYARWPDCDACKGAGGSAYDGPCTDCYGTGRMPPELKFKRTYEHDLPMPSYETAGAAGMDIRAAEWLDLYVDSHGPVRTGWAVEIPEGYELQCRPRSGLAARHGVTVLNTPGTIDSDYRGEIKVILINHGPRDFRIEVGDRIAQLVLAKVERLPIAEVAELTETQRGEGGFGSTGMG